MAKKSKETDKADTNFDFDKALTDCPKPDWLKEAFVRVIDISKIKNQSDLNKKFKEFLEMK